MMSDVDVDVFVGNNTTIDPEIYQLWLDGYSAQESALRFQKRGILQKYNVSFEVLQSDIQDHYRCFCMLERLLHNPPRLAEQLIYQIEPETQGFIIEKYYEFDSVVIREILGKKLTAKQRKDLDDVSEKTRVPLRSCRRQFDNVKRVFKIVEDMKGSLVDNIKSNFLLRGNLAKQYAAIVFLANNRFETGKKKLFYLTFEDFIGCADLMIAYWSYGSSESKQHEDMDVDFDREFFQELRELKILTEKDIIDEHKSLVCQQLKGKLSDRVYADMESNFKNHSRVLVNIATGLNHSKEARDFFIDVVEKFTDPCRQIGWTHAEISLFLKVYAEVGMQIENFVKAGPQLVKLWERYIHTMAGCIIQLYHV
ncbi:acidic fibroblast growth factor intracellular-binding protein-like [Tubulanus polymorphus]|uniref:acidic fibroblast growth factor intracellular-binding protein-like n=1 Tax=Tubulanus polymorphus TaxID=672921 RepID=UPI003DA3BAEC